MTPEAAWADAAAHTDDPVTPWSALSATQRKIWKEWIDRKNLQAGRVAAYITATPNL